MIDKETLETIQSILATIVFIALMAFVHSCTLEQEKDAHEFNMRRLELKPCAEDAQ